MSNKFRKLVRAYAEEHGYTYQAALNAIRIVPLTAVEREELMKRIMQKEKSNER